MNQKNNQYGVWTGYFNAKYAYAELKNAAQFYVSFFKANILPLDDNPDLDAWVETPKAKKMLANLVKDIQIHVKSVSEFALPAHDIRQILLKDTAEGLRFYQMERPEGFLSTFLIPMMAHDVGRLLEGKFFHPDNPHDNWIPHSQLSYLLLKAILDKPDYAEMPKALKDHYLYAVAVHSGENGNTYMSRAVQTCDRMQLIGSEGFLRALSYTVCLMEGQIKYPVWQDYKHDLPDMKKHNSVLSLIEYFARNMRENIGENHAAWQHQIAIENVAILLMACDGNPRLKERIFAPELNPNESYGPRKQKIPDVIMQAANDLYSAHRGTFPTLSSQFDVTRKISYLLQSPAGSAQLTDDMKIYLNRAMGVLMANERHSLYQTLCMAETLRTAQDECDRDVILGVSDKEDQYIQLIAAEALSYLPSPQPHELDKTTQIPQANFAPV